ncbi:HNH endonuclease [Polynucleobacter yangtzensis]|uniref:HNH endonuclease n=1 Tax=Polynucleobacter yangtzensis TaxID=1743159 RepID=UPI0024918E4B|nr:HNH endonuclease signature motif containing protein [Polynucleobacter yangtzensis]
MAYTDYRNWYNEKAWKDLRFSFLKRNPHCAMCAEENRVTKATIVDHIKAHKGDRMLFLARWNLQPLCKPHHDSVKSRMERGGKVPEIIDEDGFPPSWR